MALIRRLWSKTPALLMMASRLIRYKWSTLQTCNYDLERFVAAQDAGGAYASAVAELRAGRKTSHWMWFVFPQIGGLGMSSMSRRYAISSLEEARRYLAHRILGTRLEECARILTELSGGTAKDIFGSIDAMKLRSSMTLFARADPGNPLFRDVLDGYFGGVEDEATDARLTELARRATT